MSLRQVMTNLFTEAHTVDLSGVGYAGTMTIESGVVEISSGHFPPCEVCVSVPSVVRKCGACGREEGNNLHFLPGRGDGVYSGINLYIENEGAACLYVFDENNRMATEFIGVLSDDSLEFPEFQRPFLQSIYDDYLDLPAFYLGGVKASFRGEVTSVGFVVADGASMPSKTASVDHPFFDGSHSVYLFMEPILDSPVVQTTLKHFGGKESDFNGGYPGAMRPRVVLIVNDKHERKLLKSVETNKVDWDLQAAAWSRTLVAGNFVGGNAGTANYYNGLFWLQAAKRQEKVAQDSDYNHYLSFIQRNRSYGYFFAGALSGDDDCRLYVSDIINLEDEPEAFLEQGILSEILTPRGLKITPEVLDLVRHCLNAPTQLDSRSDFCSNCGGQLTAEVHFCTACGAKRAYRSIG